jgi:hypothetical protein
MMLFESVFPKIKTWDDIKSMLVNNKDQLQYMEKLGSVDSFLGSGENGKVWKIKGKPLTVKVTKDPNEIRTANKLSGKQLKAFVNVYMIANVKYEGKSVQVRIQDMCYDYNDAEWSMFGKILLGLYDFFNEVKRGNFKEFVEYMIRVAKEEIDDYMDDGRTKWANEVQQKLNQDLKTIQNPKFKRWFDFYTNIYDDCKKLGIKYDNLDLHSGNIMQDKDGNLRLIDF